MNALTRPDAYGDEMVRQWRQERRLQIEQAMKANAAAQLLRALAGTEGGAAKRKIKWIPADRAGEWYGEVADGVIANCRENGYLTNRQCDAARYLSECYARGGGKIPNRRHGSGIGEQSDEEMAFWKRQYDDLLSAAPRATRWALQTLCQDQWVQNIQAWRLGLDAVADRLKLAR